MAQWMLVIIIIILKHLGWVLISQEEMWNYLDIKALGIINKPKIDVLLHWLLLLNLLSWGG